MRTTARRRRVLRTIGLPIIVVFVDVDVLKNPYLVSPFRALAVPSLFFGRTGRDDAVGVVRVRSHELRGCLFPKGGEPRHLGVRRRR